MTTAFLTIAEVCALLNVSPRTIHEWRQSKKLAHFKVGRVIRFKRETVEAFVADRTVKARFSRHSHHEAGEQRDSAVADKTRGGVSVEVREGNGKCAVASPAMNERRAA